jgi:hypothetical protein
MIECLRAESSSRPYVKLWLTLRLDVLLAVVLFMKLGMNVSKKHKRGRWPWGRVPEIILRQPQLLTFLRESTHPRHKTWRSRIKSSIFSNTVERHTKTPLGVGQMEDHVCPVLARYIPTICVLLSAFLQERVSYFIVYMLLCMWNFFSPFLFKTNL